MIAQATDLRTPAPAQMTGPTKDFIRRDAEVACRAAGNLELAALIEAFEHGVAGATCEVECHINHERLLAAESERAQRLRHWQSGLVASNPGDGRYAAWSDLIGRIRQETDILDVFTAAHWPICDVTAREAHGPCPACEGHDRLVIFRDPPGRYWCRQGCGCAGDAISAVRGLIPGCTEFGAAVRYLADQLGLALPNERALLAPIEVATPPSAAQLIPIRGGGRRGR